jgi:hypothetical protein
LWVEKNNVRVAKEWEALGEIDGNDPRAIELAEKQGERVAAENARRNIEFR